MFEVTNITYVTTKPATDAADPQQLQSATAMAVATGKYLANKILEAFAALAEEGSSSPASPHPDTGTDTGMGTSTGTGTGPQEKEQSLGSLLPLQN